MVVEVEVEVVAAVAVAVAVEVAVEVEVEVEVVEAGRRTAVVKVERGECFVRRRRLHLLELERRRRVPLARGLVLG